MRFIQKDTTTAFDANASEFGPTDFFSIGVFESCFPEKSPSTSFYEGLQKFQSKPFFPWQMMNSISVGISVTGIPQDFSLEGRELLVKESPRAWRPACPVRAVKD